MIVLLSEVINKDALAIIFNSESIENDYIIYVIKSELANAGIEPWNGIEAEIYVSGHETLVMARPSPPLCKQGMNIKVRRSRSS